MWNINFFLVAASTEEKLRKLEYEYQKRKEKLDQEYQANKNRIEEKSENILEKPKVTTEVFKLIKIII